jgi:acetylornithine deacetylase/succinyl-diaminopimelate desuccinylase-like protein
MPTRTSLSHLEQLLADLVEMPTISDNFAANDAAIAYIERYVVERGMYSQCFRFDGHSALVATTRSHRKNPTIMLCAHVDVVTAKKKDFKLREKDGMLYGRGVFDMKGAIAAYLQLVEDLRNTLDEYDFGILITTDEELGGLDGINGTKKLIDAGYIPQAGVLLDGGNNWQVETKAKGGWRFDLIAKGKSGHSSRPWEAESASRKLIHAMHALETRFKDHGPLTNTLNIGIIRGGKARNQIPDKMLACVEIRLISTAAYEEDKQFVAELCERYGLTKTDRFIHLPIENDPDSHFLKAFVASIQKITGAPSGYCMSYAASDSEYFARLGVPCVVTYLPGGGHHGAEERIERRSLLQLPAVLKDYLDTTAHTAPKRQTSHELTNAS